MLLAVLADADFGDSVGASGCQSRFEFFVDCSEWALWMVVMMGIVWKPPPLEDDPESDRVGVDSQYVRSRDERPHWWLVALVPWPLQNVGVALAVEEEDSVEHNVVGPMQSRHRMLHVPFAYNESIVTHFVTRRHPSSSSWDEKWRKMSF